MNVKQKAMRMRAEGWSYGDISAELQVPKSTLSGWLRSIPYTPNQTVQDRISTGRGQYGLRRHEERLRDIEYLRQEGEKEVGRLSDRDLLMLGIGLWLGEGSKTLEQIRLVNANPEVIKLFLRWLREVCKLDNANITVAMHLYPDSNETLSRRYWMNITKLNEENFRKTQVDRRMNKNVAKAGKSPHGTLHVTVVSNRDPERGVRLYRRLLGWVAAAIRE